MAGSKLQILRPGEWRRLPPDIYVWLTARLFRISPSITVTEALLILLIGGLAARRAGDPWLAAATIITTILMVLLIPAAVRYLRVAQPGADPADVRRMERRFNLHVWAISAGIGLMASRALVAFDDMVVHLMLLLLALGATITNIRDHYRPPLPIGKTLAILLPIAVACFATGNFYYQALGLGGLIAGKLIIDICLELYETSLALRLALRDKEQLAAELAIKNDDLERRESDRVEAEAELKRLQGELVQVSRLSAMGTMASTLAHELNQPLTAVVNFARGSRRLLDTPSPRRIQQAAEGLAAVEAGALRAGQIVRRIRGLVYRGDVQSRPESLAETIEEACALALVDAHLLGVQYDVVSVDPGLWVNADSIQVQQVIVNLVRNALEAVQGVEGAKVSISAQAISDELAEVRVADNGPGISDAVKSELFSPFNSTKEQGLGVGLSISRTIVEAHGGKIWSTTGEGGGTIFRFTLPRTAQRTVVPLRRAG